MNPIQQTAEIPQQVISRHFTDARTHSAWLAKKAEDGMLRALYDIMKWGPTSASTTPARILFVRGQEAKEKLIPCLMLALTGENPK